MERVATDMSGNSNPDVQNEEQFSEEEITDEDEGDEDIVDTEETPDDPSAEEENFGTTVTQAELAADLEARKNFPLVYNDMVDMWIRYFQGRGSGTMRKWLGRSTRYIPMMKQVLREEGLPEDLIYLSMIESGFNPKAKSHAKAVGPWQFMKGTGQRYGLRVDYWVDERRDFRKSTFAAAKYLKELHQIFGSWYLAAAGYNAGEGKVLLAIRRDRSRNFWELARKKKNFRAETRNYVPKIIAAALVSKNPNSYGFSEVEFEEPLTWSTVRVPSGVDLKSVAKIIDADPEYLHLLNSELRRAITPPGPAGYELRVPPDKKEILVANLDKLEAKKIGNFVEHNLRPGESLGSLARKYDTTVSTLQELNQITNPRRLRVGQEILIPVGGSDMTDGPRRKRSTRTNIRSTSYASQPEKSQTVSEIGPGQHRVQEGESLWTISQKYKVSVDAIKRANNLRSHRNLQVGAILQIPQNSNL